MATVKIKTGCFVCGKPATYMVEETDCWRVYCAEHAMPDWCQEVVSQAREEGRRQGIKEAYAVLERLIEEAQKKADSACNDFFPYEMAVQWLDSAEISIAALLTPNAQRPTPNDNKPDNPD